MPTNIVKDLIQRIKPVNPALYDALNALANQVNALDKSIDEVRSEIAAVPITGLDIAADVTPLNYEITRRNIKFSWTQPDPSITLYELRYGTSWTGASRVLQTATTTVVIDPVLKGTHTYQLKGIDSFGNYSVNPAITTFNIYGPGIVTITSQAFGSNVLLYWSEPVTEFDINYYIIKKDGVLIGQFTGTFANLMELSGGTFVYSISAVDIAGNVGEENNITVVVPPPTDFALQDDLFSSFSGTKVNCLVDGNRLIAPINLTQTWDQHFSSKSWTTIGDQINAGYPVYAQPTLTTASYTEVFDFGTIYTNTVVTIAFTSNVIIGNVIVSMTMEFSTNGTTWTAPITSLVTYAETVRYVRVKVNFNSPDDKGLLEFYNFHVSLNVHREIDSGQNIAVAGDEPDGTIFYFNKDFKDVDSITLTTDTREPVTAIYKFIDAPNPDYFHVKAFDSRGFRITYLISWKARGIV